MKRASMSTRTRFPKAARGRTQASTAADSTMLTNDDPFQVCENAFNGPEFEGRVDEIRLYNVTLTEQQINDAKDNDGWQ